MVLDEGYVGFSFICPLYARILVHTHFGKPGRELVSHDDGDEAGPSVDVSGDDEHDEDAM